LVDLDGDGRSDVLSGSWPGEVYFFRRQKDGAFAAAVKLTHADGKEINVGHASAAFAADLDGDGRHDLVIGTLNGEVLFLPGEAGKGTPRFGKSRPVLAASKAIQIKRGDAAPVAADWDGDGLLDLVVGADDGSVVWYRNDGTKKAPRFEAARPLVRAAGDERSSNAPGERVKPCVFDWDGDGKPDLLLGDMSDGFEGKPTQLADEKQQESDAARLLPAVRKKWAAAFAAYGKVRDAEGQAERKRAGELRETMKRLKDEIARLQDIQLRYRPQGQTHGFVWLFRRGAMR
jgi:hypothetical protein